MDQTGDSQPGLHIRFTWDALKKTLMLESYHRPIKSEPLDVGTRHQYLLKALQMILPCSQHREPLPCDRMWLVDRHISNTWELFKSADQAHALPQTS